MFAVPALLPCARHVRWTAQLLNVYLCLRMLNPGHNLRVSTTAKWVWNPAWSYSPKVTVEAGWHAFSGTQWHHGRNASHFPSFFLFLKFRAWAASSWQLWKTRLYFSVACQLTLLKTPRLAILESMSVATESAVKGNSNI